MDDNFSFDSVSTLSLPRFALCVSPEGIFFQVEGKGAKRCRRRREHLEQGKRVERGIEFWYILFSFFQK